MPFAHPDAGAHSKKTIGACGVSRTETTERFVARVSGSDLRSLSLRFGKVVRHGCHPSLSTTRQSLNSVQRYQFPRDLREHHGTIRNNRSFARWPNAAIYAAAGQQDRSRQPPAATGETGSARLKERANADGVESRRYRDNSAHNHGSLALTPTRATTIIAVLAATKKAHRAHSCRCSRGMPKGPRSRSGYRGPSCMSLMVAQ
jgi:hypothetical protein